MHLNERILRFFRQWFLPMGLALGLLLGLGQLGFGQVADTTAVASTSPKGEAAHSKYVEIVENSYSGFWRYLVDEVTFNYDYKPIWLNFFYGLIAISLFFFVLELLRPWRPEQPRFRQDFWLDAFYMFFNVFLFGLIIFAAVENVFTELFNDFLGLFGVENIVAVQIDQLPVLGYFGVLFLAADFLQWWVHRLLHRVPWLWEFHKVHHSVEQMGFAAHLRYHWMENVVYRGLTAIPLTMLGYNLVDLGILHLFTLAWGHYNHSNIHVSSKVTGAVFGGLLAFGLSSLYLNELALGLGLPLGSLVMYAVLLGIVAVGVAIGYFLLRYIMRYLFNSPEMHLWHHAHDLPEEKQYGVNFGLTLSIWDWIFGTVHWPHDDGDIRLGFPGLAKFPKTFWGQVLHGVVPGRKNKP
ncbi:MAG: sterol desaturase family protein [Bacteroidota bacterium]